LTFTVNDLETPPANLTVTATSGNQTLVPNANLILGGSGTDRALLVTPAANQIGTAVITVSVSDGSASTNVQFTLTVNAFNDPPTISDIPDQNVAAGTSTAAIPFVIGDQETPAANLALTAVSANAALVPDAAVVFGGSGSNRTVTVTPASGVSGSSLITVRVSDGTNQVSDTFTVTVSGGSTTPGTNRPPTLDPINDIVLSQSGAPRPVTVTGISAGAANENQTLILAASSSDPSVVPHPLINYTSPGATATLTFVAAPFATGSATITVTLSDGQPQNGTTTRTFTAAVNTAPLIAGLGNTSIPEDSSGTSLSFTVSDADDSPETLAVTASSSNPALLPAAGVVVGGAGNNRTLTLTPLPDLFGFSTVTVSVSDANGNTNSQSLLVTVLAVNDAPTLAPLADLQLSSSAGTQTVNLSGIGSGAANETQVLSVSATSSEPAFVPNPTINYTSPSATGTLTFTPIAGAASLAVITVVVQDNGGIDNGGADRFSRTFTVTRPGPPALQIVPTGGASAQISWPGQTGSGWTLESNPQLGSAGSWSAVPGAPVLINGRYTVTVSLGSQSLFY
ncbi:MAG TPA: hypothetical protein VNM37_20450, partial [Candidatus Dormibacteraeota bacterium]|nr:hypothetical protein [Candidatus Dormibacteraeota bacterium]